ncbi:hypothetical protein MC378_09265 [Polaribacter sp. MSW13]|uniref:Uncharacterized protein n=1 Tax=Polaribacter marinus TaxID=2916838 RepID=A0A9X1VNJ4_9FLAO|nr:hypothetical protein [Polaribacter marinus]MCI2229353.1 hypothetical protein [Polaribacter marinus]
MFKKKVFIFLVLMVLFVKSTYSQCAMCKAVVENGDISIAEGVNNGITYLMVFPYLLIAVLFFAIYRYKKRAKI